MIELLGPDDSDTDRCLQYPPDDYYWIDRLDVDRSSMIALAAWDRRNRENEARSDNGPQMPVAAFD